MTYRILQNVYSGATNDIAEIARSACLNTATRQQLLGTAYLLYEETAPDKQGAKVLLELTGENCHYAGMAFANLAYWFDFGDEDLNSICAENAFYCLYRSFTECGNIAAAATICVLLETTPKLLLDKLISGVLSYYRGIYNIWTDPYNSLEMAEFREHAQTHRELIMYYLFQSIYNKEGGSIPIRDENALFFQDEQIEDILQRIQTNWNRLSLTECKGYTEAVFRECKDTIEQY